MKFELSNLKTVKNFALEMGWTPAYIYKMSKEGTLKPIVIDGVKFIDVVAARAILSK